jgi:glycerol-3-phosphate dehydrogenase (NAD(P)+)
VGSGPAASATERTAGWATGVLAGGADPGDAAGSGAPLVLAAADPAFRRQVGDALTAAGLDVTSTDDVTGVELAGCATAAAALAAAVAGPGGPNAAGSAAGKVFAEVERYARAAGAAPGTFAGPAGTGDLVAAVLGPPAAEDPAPQIPLLAAQVRAARVDAPALRGLADVVEGRVTPERWRASVTAPVRREHAQVA